MVIKWVLISLAFNSHDAQFMVSVESFDSLFACEDVRAAIVRMAESDWFAPDLNGDDKERLKCVQITDRGEAARLD